MTEEALQAALWEIVREVATVDSTHVGGDGYSGFGYRTCIYCGGDENYSERDRVTHEPDCIVLKARKLAEKGIQAEL